MDKWTDLAPNEPGLYWWRYRGSKLAVILTIYLDLIAGQLYVQRPDRDVPLNKWTGGLWAGPIKHPPIED